MSTGSKAIPTLSTMAAADAPAVTAVPSRPPGRIERMLRGGMIAWPLAALAALLVLVVNEAGHRQSMNALQRLGERMTAVATVQQVLRSLIDAESGQRGYLLTGRLVYFAPYRQAAAETQAGIDWLQAFYSRTGDARAAVLLLELQRNAGAHLATLDTTAQRAHGLTAPEVGALFIAEDARPMAEVRRLADALTAQQLDTIGRERAAVQQTLRTSRIGVNGAALLGVLALLVLLRQTLALEAERARHARAMLQEQARLESEVGRRTADLTALARHLQTVREDENSRIARELHDELGALLMATRLDLLRLRRALEGQTRAAALACVDQMQRHLDSGIALKRRIIEDLHPAALDTLGLAGALEGLAREFAERSELQVQTRLDDLPLAEAAQLTAYRLVQEALTNVAKYARASRVQIALLAVGNRAHLTVQDDGIGFDPDQRLASAHGLLGMRHRVEAADGQLRVHSAPSQGTRIDAELPLLQEADSLPQRPSTTDAA